jgi:hypothetical protein
MDMVDFHNRDFNVAFEKVDYKIELYLVVVIQHFYVFYFVSYFIILSLFFYLTPIVLFISFFITFIFFFFILFILIIVSFLISALIYL